MVKFVAGIVLFIAGIVSIIIGFRLNKKNNYEREGKITRIAGYVALVFSVVLAFASFIVVLSPGQVGIAYRLNSSTSELKVGYNFIEPWAKIHIWDVTTQVVTFSQGEAVDDIYGAQTKEKDYITVVATIGVHIDTRKMSEYTSLYGDEQISSQRILRLLKTISRNSIENTIGSYTTAEVMGNKKKIAEESVMHFKDSIKDLPIVIDSFTIDDLVAPESYENSIKEQAQLRMEREKASIQQEVNEREAAANKAKAEGEAAVLKTQAEAQAEVKRIEAENAANVAKIKADNDAEVAKIKAEADASVQVTKATAEAEATVKKGEAEATAIKAQGQAYNENPQLIDLKKTEIQADVQQKWAEKWSGFSFEGLSGFSFTNLTDIIKEILPQTSVAH